MTKINVDLPMWRPGMADIHRRATNAFRAHWRAHGGAPPQKLSLTTAQADDLHLCRRYGCVAVPGATPSRTHFNGCQIDVTDATAGVLVGHDGSEMPLADFDQLPPE